MPGESEHLRARHRAIKIRREHRFSFDALHDTTSNSRPLQETRARVRAQPSVPHPCSPSSDPDLLNIGRQALPERFPSPGQPRFHRSQRNLRDFRNFLVRHFLKVAKNQRRTVGLGNLSQFLFNSRPNLLVRNPIERRVSYRPPTNPLWRKPRPILSAAPAGSIDVSFDLCRNHQRRRFDASCTAIR